MELTANLYIKMFTLRNVKRSCLIIKFVCKDTFLNVGGGGGGGGGLGRVPSYVHDC